MKDKAEKYKRTTQDSSEWSTDIKRRNKQSQAKKNDF